MSLTVKVFYKKENGNPEIRRFTVNANQEVYKAVLSKIQQLYPTVATGNFQLSWKDSDGDNIVFSCEEEVREAISFVQDGVFRVYLTAVDTTSAPPPSQPSQPEQQEKPQQQQQQQQEHREGPFHPGVTCDGCEGPVHGTRFKCCICDDFDLCTSCEGKGLHTEHDMYRIEHPRPNPMNFLPPHLGRYIQRYMQGYWNGAQANSSTQSQSSSASASASASAGGGGTYCGSSSGPRTREQHDEYLNNVGANIAAFLDPFGIDVTYDVHHGGANPHHHRGGFRRGCGGRSSSGPCGTWQRMGRRSEAKEQKKDNVPMDTEEREKQEKTEKETAKPTSSEDVPMEENGSAEKLKKSSSEEWTFVPDDGTEVLIPTQAPIPMPAPNAQTESSTATQPSAPQAPIPMPAPNGQAGSSKATQPSTPQAPVTSAPQPTTSTCPPQPATQTPQSSGSGNIYPNLRIQQSLDQMLAMGFTNTGNWLSDLLTEYDGDIGSTLDAIKAKATQQLESLRH